ncbi:MAG: FAD-dependent oxidoreductase, partial [Candidatus Atribacteria bacterium]|nr:FAD-dependent oxidoreductase [Candidatus Atribacteria bacterium]
MKSTYDVIIIGGGPAGIFTALELADKSNLDILLIDRGGDIEQRRCPAREKKNICQKCQPCSLLCGWGGAGAFSDGKLTFSLDVGGQLTSYLKPNDLEQLFHYVDNIYLRYGATPRVYGDDGERIEELRKKAEMAELILLPSRVRHLGTDSCRGILTRIRNHLKDQITILTRTEAAEILTENHQAIGVQLKNGEVVKSQYLVVAPGRVGADWLR